MKLDLRFRSEAGNAMVLAALILLALTSVGLVAVQQTNAGLMVSGNVSRATRAGLASEAGLAHSVALLGENPGPWGETLAELRKRGLPGGGGGQVVDPTGEAHDAGSRLGLTILQRSTSVPDPGGAGQSHHLPAIVSITSPLARIQQDVAYTGNAIFLKWVRGSVGNATESDLYTVIFDVTARGGIPGGIETVLETLCPESTLSFCSTDADCTAPAACQLGRCACVSDTVVVESRARISAGLVQR